MHESGTWLDPQFTTNQYCAMFETARSAVQRIVGPSRSLFERGLGFADAEGHALPTDGEVFVRRDRVQDPRCGAWHVDGRNPCSKRWHADRAALVGVDNYYAIDFLPWRDSFLGDSYRDGMQEIEAPCSIWAKAYCADKLVCSSDGIASVPTFMLNGREFINDGGMSHGQYRECEGWSFTPKAEWNGPTYSYRSQCRAWDDGSLERGDRRGLVVRVQLCVLDGAVTVYDTRATEAVWTGTDDDEVDVVAEDGTEEERDLEEEKVAA